MPNPDWYPTALAARVAWHSNFSVQATATGTTLGLTAPQVTQIGKDSANVAVVVNFIEEVDAYRQAVTAWKDIMLEGDLGAPLPPVPGAPGPFALAIGSLPSIEARTRQYAGLIKASLAYTPEDGEHYGIIGPAAASAVTPILVATALTGSQVSLAVSKGGYAVVAIDSRTGAGAWSQIGVSMTATYIDSRGPAVAGAPEVREYRAQGMENNLRVGALSAVVSAVTVP